MRDSFIFYRSFYEAIRDLPRDIQGEIYTAIMEYGLYGNETDNLKPVARSIFTLIKPQIDVNNKRFDNGCKGGRPLKNETKEKPSNNQNETKEKPNKNDNVNDNNINKESPNGDEKEAPASSPTSSNLDFIKFNDWLKRNATFCSNPKNFSSQITETELLKLKEKYTSKQIADVIEQIENRKDLRKRYINLYRTVLNWAKKEYGD